MKTAILLGVTILVSAVGTLGYLALFDRPSAAEPARDIPREETCGPLTVWYAFQRLGHSVGIHQIRTYFDDGTCNGTTLSELEQCVEKFGLPCQVTQTDWEQLRQHDGVAILFVDDHHFIAIDPREKPASGGPGEDSLRVYDPNRIAAVWLSRQEVERIWSGETLLTSSPEPRTKTEGPALAVDYSLQDAGLLRDEFEVHYEFPVRNEGSEPLELEVIGTSCKCNEARFTRDVLAPGESAVLESVYKLNSKEGRFNGAVMVASNDPQRRHMRFNLRGAVYRTELLSTQVALLGRVDPGSARHYSVAALDPGEGRLEITDWSTKLAVPVAGSPTQPECRIAVHEFDRTSHHERRKYKLTAFDSLISFDVRVPVDCQPGPFEFRCFVETNIPSSDSYQILVKGTVRPDLFASPQALVLELSEGEQIARGQVKIRSRGGTAISGLETTPTENFSLRDQQVDLDSGSAVLDIVLQPVGEASSPWQEGSLHCVTPDGRTVEIPFMTKRATSSSAPGD